MQDKQLHRHNSGRNREDGPSERLFKWNPPDAVVVEPQHAHTTDPTVPRPRGLHRPAHRTPVPLAALFRLHPWLLPGPCPVGYCHGHILLPSVGGVVPVCQRAVICHCAVDSIWLWQHDARFSLSADESYHSEDYPHSHHRQLDRADIPTGEHLGDEHVVRVSQGEESEAEEEECPSLLAVGDVVVPQHQDGQSRQNHNAEQEVESSEVQQDRKENKRRDDRQLHSAGSAPQPGHANPVCDNCWDLRQGFRFLGFPL